MTAPIFVDTDVDAIITRLTEKYEADTGRTLTPSQSETLIINMIAYEVKVIREQLQAASLQMLVDFATAPALDFHAALVGVARLPASGAVTTLQFTVAAGHSGVVIPAGSRVATTDGQIIFQTTEIITIVPGNTTGTVSGVSTTVGAAGNGYAIGSVTGVLDPRPFLLSVTNTTVTSSGSDAETDDELRERVKIAPSQFSVAGPREAYEFFAREASASIIDVSVTNPTAGTVNVYPLVSGGVVTPTPVLALVQSTLSAEDVRPLSDTVVVLSPALVPYNIEIEITAFAFADTAQVEAAALAAVTAYANEQQSVIGQDIKRSRLTALAIGTDGQVFDVSVIAPAADVVVGDTEFPVASAITVTVTGQSNG